MIELEKTVVGSLPSSIRIVDFAIGLFPQINTRSSVKKAIKKKRLLINEKEVTSAYWVKVGDVISLIEDSDRIPKYYDLKIDIIYEDPWLLIVDKPAGLVVSGNQFRTLENALVDQTELSSEKDGYRWAKPAHRLDSPTRGLVIFAKNLKTHQELNELFVNKQIVKSYIAIVTGSVDSQRIEEQIDGQSAITELTSIETIRSLQNDYLTLVKLSPITGRTHQLRIHCQGIGSPIVGDTLYGLPGNTLLHKGLFLASTELKFIHPCTNEVLEVKLDSPVKFDLFLKKETRRWKQFKQTNLL